MQDVEALYRRFHVFYSDLGVWRRARNGKRQLHFFGIGVGRALLAKEGHAGVLAELRLLAGSFDDERIRAPLPVSALAEGGLLPEALPAPRGEREAEQEAGASRAACRVLC